jgi:anaerobic selenocysteine-containing dehydrogenase
MSHDEDDSTKRPRAGVSRRGFLAVAPVAGLAGACKTTPTAPSTTSPAAKPFDFTRASAALEPDAIVDSACQFCNSLCRIKVAKKSGRVIEIRGEPADPVQAGSLCAKAPMMRELIYNRHRVTHPMKRVSGAKGDPSSQFAKVTWDEALDGIARKLLEINPGTLTPKATLGVPARRPAGFPLVGMIGRPSVAHFASVTHWIASAKQLNGIRLVQIHPRTASAAGIANGDAVRVESPRGAVTGTALLFDGIREDTIFVPNTFGPA